MTFELSALFLATLILAVPIAVQGAATTIAHGFAWGFSSRNEPREPSAVQARAGRVVANHLESMAFFAPMVLIAQFAGVSTTLTVWGAGLFLAARAAYAVVYLIGVPVLRSLLWFIGAVGWGMIAWELAAAGLFAG